MKVVVNNLGNSKVCFISTKVFEKGEHRLREELPEWVWPLELAYSGLTEVKEIDKPWIDSGGIRW